MKIQLWTKTLVIGFIVILLGMNIISTASHKVNHINLTTIENNNAGNSRDELDQYQIIIGAGYSLSDNCWLAQSFKPMVHTFTTMELLISRDSFTSNPLKISIRNDVIGDDIISITKQPDEFPVVTFPFENWTEINFSDIHVIPEKTYYIVCTTYESSTSAYNWWGAGYNPYENGSAYTSNDYGAHWIVSPTIDYCFKTYGYANQPPNQPTIEGPHCGKINTKYWFSPGAIIDPEGDQFYCLWDGGDGYPSGWLGPYNSGEPANASHFWHEQGTYAITVKLKDALGAESKWSDPFTIYMTSRMFLIGLIKNIVNQSEGYSIVNMSQAIILQIHPFGFHLYSSVQILLLLDEFQGVIMPRIIVGRLYGLIL